MNENINSVNSMWTVHELMMQNERSTVMENTPLNDTSLIATLSPNEAVANITMESDVAKSPSQNIGNYFLSNSYNKQALENGEMLFTSEWQPLINQCLNYIESARQKIIRLENDLREVRQTATICQAQHEQMDTIYKQSQKAMEGKDGIIVQLKENIARLQASINDSKEKENEFEQKLQLEREEFSVIIKKERSKLIAGTESERTKNSIYISQLDEKIKQLQRENESLKQKLQQERQHHSSEIQGIRKDKLTETKSNASKEREVVLQMREQLRALQSKCKQLEDEKQAQEEKRRWECITSSHSTYKSRGKPTSQKSTPIMAHASSTTPMRRRYRKEATPMSDEQLNGLEVVSTERSKRRRRIEMTSNEEDHDIVD